MTSAPPKRPSPQHWYALGLLLALLAAVGVGVYSCGDTNPSGPLADAGRRDAGTAGDAGGDGSGGDLTDAGGARDGGTRQDAAKADAAKRDPSGNGATWKLPEVPKGERVTVTNDRIHNREASVPPQCYTKTEGRHNPCYVCHQLYDRRAEDRLNELSDGSLQGSYAFSELGVENHWDNLFLDRSTWVASIDDADIRAYVDADNYAGLAPRLREAGFRGFIPDLENFAAGAEAFDAHGVARDGSHWVAFNYKPFPGTFWPTNGATDDVIIRLAEAFREVDGTYSRDAYFVNLTVVELNLKQLPHASIGEVDEKALGADVDGDGKLGKATRVVARDHYVGDASDIEVAFQQFPAGTEFMHSVRYLGVDDDGGIYTPRRMKELRYMRKVAALPRSLLITRYANERREKRLGELPNFLYKGDEGFDNALGWYIQGFIEDAEGELRPQTYEEGVFCMGCHSAIGTTIDSTFSYARKITGAEGWGYIDLKGMRDAPTVNEPGGEILNYLRRAGGGNEFRENPEMLERWYRADGTVDETKVKAADVHTLLAPSARRALTLNKAYTQIVRHQSFIYGRDPNPTPAENVYRQIDEDEPPLQGEHRYYGWDLRLDWSGGHTTAK